VRQQVVSDLQAMNYDISELTGSTPLGPDGLSLDSLAVAELTVRIEDAFGVRFTDGEIPGLVDATLDELVATVAVRVDEETAARDPERA
jgi:acyl carrier protein